MGNRTIIQSLIFITFMVSRKITMLNNNHTPHTEPTSQPNTDHYIYKFTFFMQIKNRTTFPTSERCKSKPSSATHPPQNQNNKPPLLTQCHHKDEIHAVPLVENWHHSVTVPDKKINIKKWPKQRKASKPVEDSGNEN